MKFINFFSWTHIHESNCSSLTSYEFHEHFPIKFLNIVYELFQSVNVKHFTSWNVNKRWQMINTILMYVFVTYQGFIFSPMDIRVNVSTICEQPSYNSLLLTFWLFRCGSLTPALRNANNDNIKIYIDTHSYNNLLIRTWPEIECIVWL